jgi:hypothetical protein
MGHPHRPDRGEVGRRTRKWRRGTRTPRPTASSMTFPSTPGLATARTRTPPVHGPRPAPPSLRGGLRSETENGEIAAWRDAIPVLRGPFACWRRETVGRTWPERTPPPRPRERVTLRPQLVGGLLRPQLVCGLSPRWDPIRPNRPGDRPRWWSTRRSRRRGRRARPLRSPRARERDARCGAAPASVPGPRGRGWGRTAGVRWPA